MPAVPLPNAGSAALLHGARVQARGVQDGTPIPAMATAPTRPVTGIPLPKFPAGAIQQETSSEIAQPNLIVPGPTVALAPLPPLAPPPSSGPLGDPTPTAVPAGFDPSGPSTMAAPPAALAPTASPPGFFSALIHEATAAVENEARAFVPAFADAGDVISHGGGVSAMGTPMLPGQQPIVVTPKGNQTLQQKLKQKATAQAKIAAQTTGAKGFLGRITGSILPFAAQPEVYTGADLLNTYKDARARGDSRTLSAVQGVLQGSLDEFMARFMGGGKVAEKLIPKLAGHEVLARIAQTAAAAPAAQVAVTGLQKLILDAAGDKKGAAAIHPFDPQTLAVYALTPFAIEGFGALVGHLAGKLPKPGDPGANAEPPEDNGAPMPDHPTPEPQADLSAQWDDMLDKTTPRQGVLVPSAQKLPEPLHERLQAARNQGRLIDLPQGQLVLRTKAVALKAAQDLKSGTDPQAVIGGATGAGTGKTLEQSLVVQGQTPEGAVARESAVTPEEVPAKVAEVAAEGKQPVVTTPQAAIERRGALVADENEPQIEEAPPPALTLAMVDGQHVPVQLIGDAGGGSTRVQLLDANGEPGEERVIPSEAFGAVPTATTERPSADHSLLSPDGHISKAARARALQRETERLFPPGFWDEPAPTDAQARSRRVAQLRQKADELEELANRGMSPRKYRSAAGMARTEAAALEGDQMPATRGEEIKARTAAKRTIRLPAPDATRDSALQYLAKLGGVDIKEAESEGFDPEDMKSQRVGIRRAFNSKGMSLESAGEALAQDSWDVTDASGSVDKDKVLKILDDELHGRPRYSSRRDLERFAEDEAHDRALRAEFDHVAPEHGPVYDAQPEPVRDFTALADRARQIDPDATERALEVDSDDEAERRLQEIINGTQTERANETDTRGVAQGARAGEREPAHPGRRPRPQEGAADLLGEDTRAAQALADEIRRRDAGRNTGQESIETGDPSDLFSQARNQRDLTELRTEPPPGNFANRVIGELARRTDAAGFTERARRLRDGGRPASLHALLDEIGRHATGPVRHVIAAIRQHVIETPVRFVHELEPPAGKTVSAGTAGLHIAEVGRHEIQILLDHPRAHPVRVLLHEAVHAATTGALRLDPESDFAKELDRLLQIARERTDRMAGRKLTAADYKGKLYGLRNVREFLAEALSNPDFQAHLLESDNHAGARDRLVRMMSKIGEAMRRLLGVRGYSEIRLLDNVLHQTGGLMRSQAGMNDRLARIFDPAQRPDAIVHTNADTLSDAEQFEALADALEDEPDRIHNEDSLLAHAPEPIRDIVRQQLRLARRVTRGAAADWMRKALRGWATEDQLLRRGMRHFGSPDDPLNPVRRYMTTQARRQELKTGAIEPSRPVAARWARLTKPQNEELGELMRDATIWKIDPAKPNNEQLRTMQARKDSTQRYAGLRQRYEKLSEEQRGIYQGVLRDNARIARVARRAAVDSVLESVGASVTPAQRALLYAIKDPRQLDELIGDGKPVDLGDNNDLVRSSIRHLSPLVEGEFPYFHLGRTGTKVVTVKPEGDREFTTQEQAQAFAEQVRAMGPDARARVQRFLDRWQVSYKRARYAAFHASAAAAEEDATRLRGLGFDVGPVTEKILGNHGGDIGAIGQLIGEARRRIRKYGESGPAEQLAAEGLERILGTTWSEMMAERAEHIGASMRRRGVAGIPGGELRASYARHVLSVASHVATLRTIFDQSDALGRIQEASRDAQIGNADQKTIYARGHMFHELARRIQQDAEAHSAGAVQEFTSQLVAANYLISPAHAAVWALQPATVAMPRFSSEFGTWRTARAFTKAMGWAARPAVRGLIRNLSAKAEGFTDSDIAEMLVTAAEHDPLLERWTAQIRELGARGVFTHGYTNMLTDMGRGPGGHMRAAMQVGWALPQLGDTLSRITTALAGLQLTSGDVEKTADLVHETMLKYDASNRPRHFKTLDRGGLRFVTSLQSYVQGIGHLLATHIYDAITGAGRPRSEALKTLAGIALMSSVFAGLGGTTAGPISWLANGIHHAIFPNNPYDFRTALHDWLTDHMGHTAADLAYYGVPYGVGVNLSHRIGIGDLFRNFSDLAQATNWEQTMGALGQIVLGPLGSGIEQHWRSFNLYASRGDWLDALSSIVPLKVWDDALKGIDLMRHGYQGNTVSLPPLGAGAAVTQAAGFQPAPVAKAQSKAEALYRLNQQRYGRKQQLIREWFAAHDKPPTMAQIEDFNRKNPGAAITYADFRRATRQKAQAQRSGAGLPGRDPTMTRALRY